MEAERPRKCSDCPGCQKCSSRGQQYAERETMEYKAIEPRIRLYEELLCSDAREEQSRRDQHQEAAEPEGHGTAATSQSKADVTSRHKGEEENVEVQYAGQDDTAKLSNNLGRDIKIAEKEEEILVKEGLIEEFYGQFNKFTRLATQRELS